MFWLGVVITSAIAIALSAYLYLRASGEPVWRLNMLTYSFWLLLATSFVSSTIVLLDIPFPGYSPESNLFGPEHRLSVWMMMIWTMLGIPAAAYAANFVCGVRSVEALMRDYRASRLSVGWDINEWTLFRIVLAASGILGLILLLTLPDTTALSNVIATGDVVGSQILRRESQFGTGIQWFDWLFNLGTLQLLSYIAFGMAIATRRTRWALLFFSTFLIVSFLALSDASISRFMYYILGIAVVRSVMGKAFVRLYELLIVAALLVVFFVTFKGVEGDFLTVLLHAVASRTLFSQLIGTYFALDVFPAQHSFIGLASTGRAIHELLGMPYTESYGIVMMELYNPGGVELGSAGHLTTMFLGEAWANFGLVGVIIAPIWVGAIVQIVNLAFIRRRKSVTAVALYVYLSITFEYLRGIVGFYYPLGTVFLVFGAMGILAIGRWLLTKPAMSADS